MVTYRGTTFEEMDVDAVLARRPAVALVDELAHTNVPGSGRTSKRREDVEELLATGITVISTLNIQHLESINDVVERITGIKQRATIPDEIVRQAEQIELVDMTAEALRRRMAHGNIYAADKIDTALANNFRVGNLTALRELALLWVADQVDEALESYRERHGITDAWETRERVIVAVTGAPGSDQLIRRAARIAQRTHGELIGVHVVSDTGLSALSSATVAQHRWLLGDLGGQYREVSGGDVAAALIDVARAENATQVVLGATRRSRWQELIQGSVANRGPAARRGDRRPRHLGARRAPPAAPVAEPAPDPEPGVAPPADVGVGPRTRRAAAADPAPDPAAGRVRTSERAAVVPVAGDGRCPGGRGVPGPGRGARRVAPGQLVLHSPAVRADDRRHREPACAGGVRRGRRHGERAGRPGRPQPARSGSGPGRGRGHGRNGRVTGRGGGPAEPGRPPPGHVWDGGGRRLPGRSRVG